eukprot:7062945-Pyramimonas_sp.AAC.3
MCSLPGSGCASSCRVGVGPGVHPWRVHHEALSKTCRGPARREGASSAPGAQAPGRGREHGFFFVFA